LPGFVLFDPADPGETELEVELSLINKIPVDGMTIRDKSGGEGEVDE
jgi:hypothetical protein